MDRWLRRATQGGVIALALGALLTAAPVEAAGWSQQTTGVTWNIEGIAFNLDDNVTGVAVGTSGNTLYTTDGGDNWSAGAAVSGGRTLYDVTFSDANPIAVGTFGTIAKSEDKGATWTTQTSGTSSHLYGIAMNGSAGIAVGASGTVLKTSDGGATWTAKTSGTTEILWDVQYIDSVDVAIAVGANGTIIYSLNDGENWKTASSGVSAKLHGIDFRPSIFEGEYTAAAVGANGTYLTSTDLTTWTANSTGASTSSSLVDIAMAESVFDSAIIVGDAAILKSHSDGEEWRVESYSSGLNATARAWIENTAWVAGDSGRIYAYNNDEVVMSTISPTTATVGTAVTFTLTAESDSDIESCDISIDGASDAPMTIADNTATYTHTFTSAGDATVYAFCEDFYGANGGTDDTIVTVSAAATPDTTAPTVSSITPTSATAGTAVTLSATYSDAVGVTSCTLYIGGVSQGTMTLASGTATKSHTFSSSAYASGGTTNAKVMCQDAAGNTGSGAVTSITIAAPASSDTTAPTVTASPITATVGVATTVSATYSDNVGVTSCTITVDGTTRGMALASGTASSSGTFTTAGSFTATVSCEDAAGNKGTSSTTLTVNAATSTDTTSPTVGAISPTSATQNTAATFQATVTDNVGIQECRLYVNGSDQGAMTAGSSNTYSRSYTPASSGSLTAYARCGDTSGNVTSGTSVTVTVAAAASSGTDVTAPTVGAITPSTATEDTAVTLRATVADSVGVTGCTLYVNSANAGSMTIAGGYATKSYTFTAAGTGIANAYCWDAAGNTTRGASTTIEIAEAASEEEEAEEEAEPGNLLKLACDGDSDVNDPCRAVYYYSEEDGKRHAFPNEKVFFSWYANFEDVIIVTDEFMASLTLGRNVTYKPGVTMVKFITVNTVYAVGEEGELRAIDSEDTARSIWGSTWNQQIHDISDAFYSNYQFGEDINSTSDYDPDDVEDLHDTIDDLLEAQS